MSFKVALVVDPDRDNVATILRKGVEIGEAIVFSVGKKEFQIAVRSDIPYGHKLAISPIKTGEAVIKYGTVIGKATVNIEIGEHVHVHNIDSFRGRGDLVTERGVVQNGEL
ncbi:UxaA family hydrolase [Desulfosporosinus burensis]